MQSGKSVNEIHTNNDFEQCCDRDLDKVTTALYTNLAPDFTEKNT